MNFRLIAFLILLTLSSKAQSINFEQFGSDTVINSFVIDGYTFDGIKLATNYGDNFDINGSSLFIYKTALIISRTDNAPFCASGLRIYQVSEALGDSLIVEGWLLNTAKYIKVFANIDEWKSLLLNYLSIDKLIVRSKNLADDYNLDNIFFEYANCSSECRITKKVNVEWNLKMKL